MIARALGSWACLSLGRAMPRVAHAAVQQPRARCTVQDAIAPSDHQARLTEHEKNKALQAELAALQEDSALKLENAELQEKITKLKAEVPKLEDVAALTHAERIELLKGSRATRAVDAGRRGGKLSTGSFELGGGSNRAGND